MQTITKAQFLTQIADYENKKKLEYLGENPIIVVFWKNSYSHNQMFFDCIETIENRFAQQIIFYSADVDQEPFLAADLGIRKIPTWLLFPPHHAPQMFQGVPDLATLIETIEKICLH